MRYIYDDRADGNIIASTADANYPVTNLSDYNPKSVWKATAAGATLTVTVANVGLMDHAIFNCNDTDTIGWQLFNGAVLLASGSMEFDGQGNHWLDNQNQATATKIVFTINSGIGVATAGILRSGVAVLHFDPLELRKSYRDFSLINRTRNQALDIREKETVWLYSGSVLSHVISTNGNASIVIHCKLASPYPFAVKVLEVDYTDFVFGLVNASVSDGQITWKTDGFGTTDAHLMCSFEIEEVL